MWNLLSSHKWKRKEISNDFIAYKKVFFHLYNTLNDLHSLLLKLDWNKILFVCKLLQFKSGFGKKKISFHRQFLKILHFLQSMKTKCNKLVIGLFLMQESQSTIFHFVTHHFTRLNRKLFKSEAHNWFMNSREPDLWQIFNQQI